MINRLLFFAPFAVALAPTMIAAEPILPGVAAALQPALDTQEIAGAVTLVVSRDRIVHFETHGFADLAARRPLTADSMFDIMSMTKPMTAVAVLMLQDEGKLDVAAPVANYLPEFAALKTPSGQPANLTLRHLLTHTSGLGEAPAAAAREARKLADLVPAWLAAPMNNEPGAKWRYCQSGINAAARIVEIVSGLTFDEFLRTRLFVPLGLTHTAHYPTAAQLPLLATPYAKNKTTGALEVHPAKPHTRDTRPPTGNAGLYSTAHDYARFCQMLLNGGTLDGRRYLSSAAMRLLSTPQTPGEMPTGFFQSAAHGQYGPNYGWGLGTCVLKNPHPGLAAMLSPGTYGHGGAWGTQAWIDPVRGIAYMLMVQRTNFPNSDASPVRLAFQQAAAAALAKP